ncbi:thioesterase family protein [Polaromonas sp.]|uniref:thioesterase family protein n=1 Tax=Polaromonas sp. TaxID=1869339 RepID=UPI002FC85F97
MNLYFRLIWTWLRARFKPPIQMGDTIAMQLRVLPTDLDVNGHMNNGRYMTIVDLALIEYFTRAGFLPVALQRGWRPMLGGSMIAFRRGLKPFTVYTLRFSMQCWDERWNYMRFEFEHAGQSMAVGYTKGAVVGPEGIVSNSDSRAAMGLDPTSPAFPAPVSAWIEADRLMRS